MMKVDRLVICIDSSRKMEIIGDCGVIDYDVLAASVVTCQINDVLTKPDYWRWYVLTVLQCLFHLYVALQIQEWFLENINNEHIILYT